MSGGKTREPINLILAKGKAHFSKDKIEERRAQELNVPFTNIVVPDYLTAKQKREFNKYAELLLKLEIFTELDVDILAQYCVAHDLYLTYSDQIKKLMSKNDVVRDWKVIDKLALECDDEEQLIDLLETLLRRQRGAEITSLMNLQDKAFKQCVACAREMGLTITSRVKLVIPKPPEDDDDEL